MAKSPPCGHVFSHDPVEQAESFSRSHTCASHLGEELCCKFQCQTSDLRRASLCQQPSHGHGKGIPVSSFGHDWHIFQVGLGVKAQSQEAHSELSSNALYLQNTHCVFYNCLAAMSAPLQGGSK